MTLYKAKAKLQGWLLFVVVVIAPLLFLTLPGTVTDP
jgi:hypothetical protein